MDAALYLCCLVAWPGQGTLQPPCTVPLQTLAFCSCQLPPAMLDYSAGTSIPPHCGCGADLRFWHQQEGAEGENDKLLRDMHPHGELPCSHSLSAFPGSPDSLPAYVKLLLEFPYDLLAASVPCSRLK